MGSCFIKTIILFNKIIIIIKKYTNKGAGIDFNKNSVLVILKPPSSTIHSITFKDISNDHDTLTVRYIYEVTNKEAEGPPKKFGLVIPKTDIPVKVVEHYILEREVKVESIRTKDLVFED